MNELDYVLKSLKNIDSHYYSVMGITSNIKYQQAAENAFTAELYHQLKISQPDYTKDKLIWHFDLNKERAKSIRPDLVLHQSPNNRKDQRIYIEVKTNIKATDKKLKNDLEKLKKAVSENDNSSIYLGFKTAFFIVGNIILENKKNLFIEIFENESENILNKIHIIHFNSNNYIPTEINLNQLIE